MQQKSNQSLQLIDEHKHFSPQALKTVLEPFRECDKDYFTVAIIGSQNTGKSTLLNHLFHTKFKVLEGLAGSRTTRGVILGRDINKNLVLMDVEGNDSYDNHLEGGQNYQKMVSSFALVASNLLIVNIQEKQLGQHTGSQYEILAVVLRICIDQFKQESPKTILFCLRDANPDYTDEGECKRKLQTDMQHLWKNVWAGTKKAADFQKYEATPDRFFTLQTAFLRQYSPDYPQDFIQDVAKLRQRFVDPQHEGYLFKRQKKDFNVPASDLPLLLSNIWTTLTSNKQLNLPNEKIQLANYRCEEFYFEVEKKYEQELNDKSEEELNYGQFLEQMIAEFRQKAAGYNKTITEKWEKDLLDNFQPKIHKSINNLLEKEQTKILQQYSREIKQNIFYSDQKSFKDQSKQIYNRAIQKYITLLRDLGYQLQDRKVRIQSLESKLDKENEEETKDKLSHIEQEFNREGLRQMSMLAATLLRQHFGLEFWSKAYTEYRKLADSLLKELGNRYLWVKGVSTTSNQLDQHQEKLYNCLVGELKREFENNLPERLLNYFKKHFSEDQHGSPYNFNAMQEQKISDHYTQAKEMTIDLLNTLNDFKFQIAKRSSFISDQDFQTQNQVKPFLQANRMLSIRQAFEQKANNEYYTVIRRKKQSQSKKVPWYMIVIIIFFMYDDLPSPTENRWTYKFIALLLVMAAIPFAFGQGHVVMQVIDSGTETIKKKIGGLFKGKSKEEK